MTAACSPQFLLMFFFLIESSGIGTIGLSSQFLFLFFPPFLEHWFNSPGDLLLTIAKTLWNSRKRRHHGNALNTANTAKSNICGKTHILCSAKHGFKSTQASFFFLIGRNTSLKDAIAYFSFCSCEHSFVLLLIPEHPPILGTYLCDEVIRTALRILDYKKQLIYRVALEYFPHYSPG